MLLKPIIITAVRLPSFHVLGGTIWKPLQADEGFCFCFFFFVFFLVGEVIISTVFYTIF